MTENVLQYVGNELHTFRNATNWKNYWTRSVAYDIKGDVLEVGCGLGANINYILRNTRAQTYTGIEPDKELAARALSSSTHNPKVKAIFNATLSDNWDKTFDTILYIDVLEHILDDQEEILRARRFLRPNGNLIILVPSHMVLYSGFDLSIGHYRRYSKRHLSTLLEQSGLKILKSHSLDVVGYLVSSVFLRFFQQKATPKSVKIWDSYIVPLSRFIDPCLQRLSVGKSLVVVAKRYQYIDT